MTKKPHKHRWWKTWLIISFHPPPHGTSMRMCYGCGAVESTTLNMRGENKHVKWVYCDIKDCPARLLYKHEHPLVAPEKENQRYRRRRVYPSRRMKNGKEETDRRQR